MLEVVEVELVPGLVLAGRYRLEQPIGRGGFGVVWAAVDVVTGEPRALKCLTEVGAADAKRQERLRREARAMSSITHPHIARVFGLEELPAGTPFIVMELLRGLPLHAHLRGGGPLSPTQARGVLIQIADALRTVHAQGIVHRDLKPANVMIVDERTVKVVDFGIAKDLTKTERQTLTTTGTALGTLNYMAPEQIFGEKNLDGRCDVWALGILAHECMTLRRPTNAGGDNSGQVLKAILEGSFPRLSTLVRDVPPDLDELVARMLARNVALRPTSAEVLEILMAPGSARSLPGRFDKTAQMGSTLPLSDAPLFARTIRDEAFAGSQLVPSTVIPSTVVPPTVVPSTLASPEAMPSTDVPSTEIPSKGVAETLSSPPAVPAGVSPATAVSPPFIYPTLASRDGASGAHAPAVTPADVMRQADAPTFDIRMRRPKPRSRAVTIAIAMAAALAVVGAAAFGLIKARTGGEVSQTATSASASAPSPVLSTLAASTASASASTSASGSASASTSAVASATPAKPGTRPSPAATAAGRTGSVPGPAAPNDAPPPITDVRF